MRLDIAVGPANGRTDLGGGDLSYLISLKGKKNGRARGKAAGGGGIPGIRRIEGLERNFGGPQGGALCCAGNVRWERRLRGLEG